MSNAPNARLTALQDSAIAAITDAERRASYDETPNAAIPALAASLAAFRREFDLAMPGELQRRLGLISSRTKNNSNYQHVAERAWSQIGEKMFSLHHFRAKKLTGRVASLTSIEQAEAELSAVRAWSDSDELAPAQKPVAKEWEGELNAILAEARQEQVRPCEWFDCFSANGGDHALRNTLPMDVCRDLANAVGALMDALRNSKCSIDKRDYVPFAEAHRPDGIVTDREFRSFLEKAGVRTHKPLKQRLLLHAGDLARATTQRKREQDALLENQTVDEFDKVARERKKEVGQGRKR